MNLATGNSDYFSENLFLEFEEFGLLYSIYKVNQKMIVRISVHLLTLSFPLHRPMCGILSWRNDDKTY